MYRSIAHGRKGAGIPIDVGYAVDRKTEVELRRINLEGGLDN